MIQNAWDFAAAVRFILEIFLELASWLHRLLRAVLIPLIGAFGITGDVAETLAFIMELIIFIVLIEKAAGVIKWVLLLLLLVLIIGAIYTIL
ncbi:MAG: hypothetical protein NZ992_01295 [Candidatus Korarchaeum sp.]|nr:hypothetical protein [Candidatus Korarchaeum sp.]MDW8035912.1 hypothetical protein [Candidatus Korarchaeum sp.]